jgi:hypothetical protein
MEPLFRDSTQQVAIRFLDKASPHSANLGSDLAWSIFRAKSLPCGLEGLRIVEASVMPARIRGNSAPINVIGEKPADTIRGIMMRVLVGRFGTV